MEILIGISVFLFTLLFIYTCTFLVRKIYRPEERKARHRLRILSLSGPGKERTDIQKKKALSGISWLNRILLNISFLARVERFLGQADSPHPFGVFVLLSALLFLSGLLIGNALYVNVHAGLVLSVLPALAPFYYLSWKRKKRIEKFERQLPEALELVARSLKAGHAFTGALKMVAEEFDDPAGVEFAVLLDEINFGAAVPEALGNLTRRIDCEDLKYFVVSVNIQRETGGNLAEILEGLGHLIRERFKLQGRVRALSAEGRISAFILAAMPFFVAGGLYWIRPDYMGTLFTDPVGRMLIATAVAMMTLGIYLMKQMISIKV